MVNKFNKLTKLTKLNIILILDTILINKIISLIRYSLAIRALNTSDSVISDSMFFYLKSMRLLGDYS